MPVRRARIGCRALPFAVQAPLPPPIPSSAGLLFAWLSRGGPPEPPLPRPLHPASSPFPLCPMNERNAIGVVGGLGPYAGLDLVKKVFDNTVAATRSGAPPGRADLVPRPLPRPLDLHRGPIEAEPGPRPRRSPPAAPRRGVLGRRDAVQHGPRPGHLRRAARDDGGRGPRHRPAQHDGRLRGRWRGSAARGASAFWRRTRRSGTGSTRRPRTRRARSGRPRLGLPERRDQPRHLRSRVGHQSPERPADRAGAGPPAPAASATSASAGPTPSSSAAPSCPSPCPRPRSTASPSSTRPRPSRGRSSVPPTPASFAPSPRLSRRRATCRPRTPSLPGAHRTVSRVAAVAHGAGALYIPPGLFLLVSMGYAAC